MSIPMQRIAVLDIGKTNAKLVVLDCATGQELAVLKTPNQVLQGPPYPHYDVEELWAFFIDALKSVAQTPGFDAISITTHGASAALLDEQGALALPVLDYEHDYPQAVRSAYADIRPPFSETFSPKLSAGLNLGAQLHYQQTVFPDDFARVRTIITYPQYWAFRLTGIAANELTSLGCHTDLWQPQAANYSALVDRLGIRQQLAPVRSAFDALGPMLSAIAADIGLAMPVPVFCGIHDSNASLLPHLLNRDAPFSVVSTGTWVVSFAVGGDLSRLDPGRDTLANVDAHGRPVSSARFMGGREFEVLTASLPQPSPTEMDAAFGVIIGRMVMILPNVVPGSGPFPGRAIEWIGEANTPAERLAAASLYAALMSDVCLGLIGARGPTLVEGPFAKNSHYLKALAALTGRNVIGLAGSTGTALGAALLSGASLPYAHPEQLFTPGLVDLAAYREKWNDAVLPAQETDSQTLAGRSS
jgi:sugar (pentulose or hexulose) kinase